MRAIFILIVIGALGYLGYTFKDDIATKATAVQQGKSLFSTDAPSADSSTPPAPATSQADAPPPLAPGEKRLAPPGVFYVKTRISIMQDTGIKALNPGEEVKLMYHNKDGTARVSVGKYDFVVNESDLTNDIDMAQKLAATAPRPH